MLCPKCGAVMARRIVRNGPRKGKMFWGCSRYPVCDGLINIESEVPAPSIKKESKPENTIIGKQDYGRQIGQKNAIRPYYARPLPGMEAMAAYDSIAVSKQVLHDMSMGLLSYDFLQSCGKFRVDYGDIKGEVDPELDSLCSLVLRFLLRGNVTLNSPRIERAIESMFPDGDIQTKESFRLEAFCADPEISLPVDSQREEFFLDHWLKPFFGDEWYRYVSTQVKISSLVDDPGMLEDFRDTDQRVDFLISYDGRDCIIELDGEEHQAHTENDERRNSALEHCGYLVKRFSNEKVDNQSAAINRWLKDTYRRKENRSTYEPAVGRLVANKWVHQIQIAVTGAIQQGVIAMNDQLTPCIRSLYLNDRQLWRLFSYALQDLKELFSNFSGLYNLPCEFDIRIARDGKRACFGCSQDHAALIVSEVSYHRPIRNEIRPLGYLELDDCEAEILRYFLSYVYRFPDFREGQMEAIQRALRKKDSIILLPTGSGKSLVYQLSSLLAPGKTIVVSPLRSLIQDQVANIQSVGMDCIVDVKHDNPDSAISDPRITMIYVTPERLQVEKFRRDVSELLISDQVCTVAIDEAHCISEWGHDFRPAYLNIGRTSRVLFRKHGTVPAIIALTGTASSAVLKDMKRELEIHDYDAIITPVTFDRSELHYSVYESQSADKDGILRRLISKTIPQKFHASNAGDFFRKKRENPNSGIVFCPHVNGEYGVADVSNELRSIVDTGIYSGGRPKAYQDSRFDWDSEKASTATEFKQNKIPLLIATKSFGMGIDKPNVRFTVHYNLPSSIESFYQEAGRAGRDGNRAECVIILSQDNGMLDDRLLDPSMDLADVREAVNSQPREGGDDISRALYFHLNSFAGIDEEIEFVKEAVSRLYESGTLVMHNVVLSYAEKGKSGDAQVKWQKALQRLLVLGVIRDYTVNYADKELCARPDSDEETDIAYHYRKYVAGYNEGRCIVEMKRLYAAFEKASNAQERTVAAAEVLIDFIYDTIEKGRRRGLREMLNIANAALATKDQDETIRSRIVRYFESTYAEEIDRILVSERAGFDCIPLIFDGVENEIGERIGGIKSANEAMGLRGQLSRYLESTPDHPGLLALRSLAELYTKEYDVKMVRSDFSAFIKFAKEKYAVQETEIIEFLQYFFKKCGERDTDVYFDLVTRAMEYLDQEALLKAMLSSDLLTEEMKAVPAEFYFPMTAEKILGRYRELKESQDHE